MSSKRTTAFTLIELLVVIAIISLLVSILLPSLTRAKALAKRVQCQANLHSLGISWGMYWAENEGCIPMMSNWYQWCGYDFAGSLFPWYCPTPYEDRPLSPYVADSPGVLKCPDDNDSGAVNDIGNHAWYATGTSYTINMYVAAVGWGGSYVDRNEKFAQPSRTLFVGDATMYCIWSTGTGFPWSGAVGDYTWHAEEGLWSNMLLADGHVEYLVIDQHPNAEPIDTDYEWFAQP